MSIKPRNRLRKHHDPDKPPLYRANGTFARKTEVYRVSFLVGRRRCISVQGIQTADDGYFYSGNAARAADVMQAWLRNNRQDRPSGFTYARVVAR